MDYIHVFEIMASILFIAYLFWASLQDVREMKVARYTHLLAVLAIICTILSKVVCCMDSSVYENRLWLRNLWEILLSCSFHWIGCRLCFYGLADVFVMNLCDVFYFFQSGTYGCLFFCFASYATSGILLLVVQLINGNLKGFHLKRKVPYIPYISIAFFLTKWVI